MLVQDVMVSNLFKQLQLYANNLIKNKEKQKKEYYISGVIKKNDNIKYNF